MKSEFLETGEIVNTHGVRGEIKIMPWADSPGFLCQFDTLYIDGKAVKVLSSRVHKTAVLCTLEGVDSVEKAMKLKGKVVSLRREQIQLPEGYHFLVDLVGLKAIDAATGEVHYETGSSTECLYVTLSPKARHTLAVLDQAGIFEEGYALTPWDSDYDPRYPDTVAGNGWEIVY